MKKMILSLVIFILAFGSLVTAAEGIKVPLSAVKSSCYGQIDMSKAEFSLLEIGKKCVKDSWLEENLSESNAEKENSEEGDRIKIGSLEFEEGVLDISGTTNLMDGSILFYSILNEDDSLKSAIEGEMVVSDGKFNGKVNISELGEGKINVLVGFHPFAQSEAVREVYGDWGGDLQGESVEFIEADVKGAEGYNRIWVEENLFVGENQAEGPKEAQKRVETGSSFDVSRNEIFDLLKNPQKIEPELSSGWQYAVSGWERSDLSDGTARWLAQSGDYYNYELIGQPTNKFTLMAGVTGESEDSANLIVRALLVIRATGVAKENANSILTGLIEKAAENPNTKFEVESDDILIQMQLIKSISTLSLTLKPA